MATSALAMVLTLAALLAIAGAQPAAPAPAPEPLDVPAILAKARNHNTFVRLLHDTQVDIQINNELKDTANAFTVLAPTDTAFTTLKAGALNTLTDQDQVELVLYHILPHYYSLASFETASNPVRTQASGNHGAYTFNVTTDNNQQVNISTGIVHTTIAGKLFDDSQQLAVYSLETVLLPNDLFGPKPPAQAPGKKNSTTEGSAEATAGPAAGGASGVGLRGRAAGWRLAAGAGLVGVAASLL